MSNEPAAIARPNALARVHRIVTDYAGGYRAGLTRADALAELAATAAGPELLSRVAALHAVADNWYAIAAVDLLMTAGATYPLMERHLDEHPPDELWRLAGLDSTAEPPASWVAEPPAA